MFHPPLRMLVSDRYIKRDKGPFLSEVMTSHACTFTDRCFSCPVTVDVTDACSRSTETIAFFAHESDISSCPEFFAYYVSICKRSWFVAQTVACRIIIIRHKFLRMLEVVFLFQDEEILEGREAHLIWQSIVIQIKSLHKYVHLLPSSSIGKSLL